jgi:ABC-type multidrug transport system fused ATPase/permease subunit
MPDVHDGGLEPLDSFRTLEVKDLSFTYPGASHPALKGLNFTLRKGEVIGIVGPVGSGKSTLVQLLGRIRPAPPQTIFVNGRAVEEFELDSWRARMAIAPQDTFLFSRSVQDNILFGQAGSSSNELHPELNPDAIATADAVALREEIERLPLGFRAWLGEKGVNLSGGQKQRMTIARALAHSSQRLENPADIIVLDDSLSAVDAKTEAAVLSAVRKEMTAIIISHRLAAVRHADRIIVLNAGEIEAVGRHDELVQESATYRRIHELQSSQSTQSETSP